jgi:hypothetical protein
LKSKERIKVQSLALDVILGNAQVSWMLNRSERGGEYHRSLVETGREPKLIIKAIDLFEDVCTYLCKVVGAFLYIFVWSVVVDLFSLLAVAVGYVLLFFILVYLFLH